MNNTDMVCYDRIGNCDINKTIDINKNKCIREVWYLSLLGYFKQKVLSFNYNLSDIAILNIKGSDHWYVISWISKSEAMKLLQILTGIL